MPLRQAEVPEATKKVLTFVFVNGEQLDVSPVDEVLNGDMISLLDSDGTHYGINKAHILYTILR